MKMKRKMKRFLSGALVFMMVFAFTQWPTMSAKASEGETVSLHFQESNGKSGFYFTTKNVDTGAAGDSLAYSGNWDVRYTKTAATSGGVYVDGSLSGVALVKIASDRYYVALSDCGYPGTTGMKVVIEACWSGVTFERTAFKFDGTTWSQDHADGKNAETVSVHFNESNGTSGFYFTTKNVETGANGDSLAYKTDWSLRYGKTKAISGGISVDGTLNSSITVMKIAANRYYIPLSEYITVRTGTEIKIDVCWYDDEDVVTFEETTFKYDGTTWKLKQDKIKFQITSGTTAETDTTDLRLITYADSLDYRNVIFNVEIGGQTANVPCTTVYETLVAGNKTYDSAEAVFGDSAAYFVTYTFTDIPASIYTETITVSVTWTDLDGNTTTSESRDIVISSAFTN